MTMSAESPASKEETAGASTDGADGNGLSDSTGVNAAAPPAPAGGQRVPDFFIVGHPKCGTTALHQMLRRHPQIHMPLKEPRFFSQELRSRFIRLGPGRLPLTLDEYLALFAAAGPEQRAGEASPQYLRSHHAAGRIAEVQPDARIIAILREPASFLRSFHLQAVHNHVETQRDFAKAIRLEDARRAGHRIPPFSQAPQALLYSEHVRYVEQLRRFHDVFAPEQVLVLIYDDFRHDNQATVRRVLRFLEVDDSLPIEPIQTTPLPAVRSTFLYQLSSAASIASRKLRARRSPADGVRAQRSHAARESRVRAAWRRALYTQPRPPDEHLMLELRRRFKGEVLAASEYLGRDLVSEWGYQNVR